MMLMPTNEMSHPHTPMRSDRGRTPGSATAAGTASEVSAARADSDRISVAVIGVRACSAIPLQSPVKRVVAAAATRIVATTPAKPSASSKSGSTHEPTTSSGCQ